MGRDEARATRLLLLQVLAAHVTRRPPHSPAFSPLEKERIIKNKRASREGTSVFIKLCSNPIKKPAREESAAIVRCRAAWLPICRLTAGLFRSL